MNDHCKRIIFTNDIVDIYLDPIALIKEINKCNNINKVKYSYKILKLLDKYIKN